jgi:hypothetical protein
MMRLLIRIGCLAALVCVLAGCGPNAENAAPSPNMSVFVTSVGAGDGGNLGGLLGADKHCQTLAGAVGAGDRTWHAYLSAHSESSGNATAGTDSVARAAAGGTQAAFARYRIGEGPWFNARGEQVAKDLIEIHKTTSARILDEKGREIKEAARAILTGARPDGTAFPTSDDPTCGNWKKNAGKRARRTAAGEAGPELPAPRAVAARPIWPDRAAPGCSTALRRQPGPRFRSPTGTRWSRTGPRFPSG